MSIIKQEITDKTKHLAYNRGYEMDYPPFEISYGLLMDAFEIVKGNNVAYLNMDQVSEQSVINQTHEFYDSLFKLHNVVATITGNTKLNITKDSSEEDIAKEYLEKTRLISPYDIPIYKEEDPLSGSLKYDDFETKSRLQPRYYPFVRINIEKELNKYSFISYIHELMHTQIESRPGYTKDFLNSELITYFVSFLAAHQYEESHYLECSIRGALYKSILLLFWAINYNNSNINTQDLIFVNSTVKAIRLFNIYLEGEKEIISYCQRIMDGSYTLDELLKKYDISFKSSFDLKLIRKYQ